MFWAKQRPCVGLERGCVLGWREAVFWARERLCVGLERGCVLGSLPSLWLVVMVYMWYHL